MIRRFTNYDEYHSLFLRDSEHENHENDVLVINEFGLKIVDDVTQDKVREESESAPCISIPELEPGQPQMIQVQLPTIDNQGI